MRNSTTAQTSKPISSEIQVSWTVEAEAYELEANAPTKSRLTQASLNTYIMENADQDFDTKAELDLALGFKGRDCLAGAGTDCVSERRGEDE